MRKLLLLLFLAVPSWGAVTYNGAIVVGDTLTTVGESTLISTATISTTLIINRAGQYLSFHPSISVSGTGEFLIRGNSAVTNSNFRMRYQARNTGTTITSLLFNPSNISNTAEVVGLNIADANDVIRIGLERGGLIKASSTTLTGYIQPGRHTLAELATIIPSAVGQEYYCSDCTTTTNCTSTQTVTASWAGATRAACQ